MRVARVVRKRPLRLCSRPAASGAGQPRTSTHGLSAYPACGSPTLKLRRDQTLLRAAAPIAQESYVTINMSRTALTPGAIHAAS